MKKGMIKGVVFTLVFFISVIVISMIMNKGNNDMTVEMGKATYPVVYMQTEGQEFNALHGYAESMNESFQRDTITPLGRDRNLSVRIDPFGQKITGLAYEVRNIEGERLIENTEIKKYRETEQGIRTDITLKDLIEKDTEYNLVFLVTTEEGNTIRYYTRIVWGDSYYLKEELDFVMDFHEKTFDKEAAKSITKYLESNAEGDNTTLSRVTIHSSFKQITWGDLQVRKEGEPIVEITELSKGIGSFRLMYTVSDQEGKEEKYYRIEENYRVRYTADRIYLLNYNRTMQQYFDEEAAAFINNKIILGIMDSNIPFTESEDGNNIVFVCNNRLYSYHLASHKLAILFGFYDKENHDIRDLYNHHDIKIMNVDETGNVQFFVYGYMNRGRHEGNVGIQSYYYNSTLNTIEEAVYIPYHKSYQVLQKEMEQLSYINRENQLYFLLDNSVYGISLTDKTYQVIVEDIGDGNVKVSDSNKMLVWQVGNDVYAGRELQLMDLNSGRQTAIRAGKGEYILPMGFMEEDLIYGLVKQEDVQKDSAGRITFPVYCLFIRNAEGRILKTYQQENVYITECSVTDNQITLKRISRKEDGTYQEISDDQIMNNEAVKEGENILSTVATEKYEKIVQIIMKDNAENRALKVLTPREVLFEGGRQLDLQFSDKEDDRYYVYETTGVVSITSNPALAVRKADEVFGCVIDGQGRYIWKSGDRSTRNQIMAIKAQAVDDKRSSLAVCADTILGFEGIMRDSQALLSQGISVHAILQENMNDVEILDLTGCRMETILYYVNQDIPVMALLNDGRAVLIIGFNEFNIVVMDPVLGVVEKRGMKDSAEWFAQNGNSFITYARKKS